MTADQIVTIIGEVAVAATAVVPLVLSLRGNTAATKASTDAAVAHTDAIVKAVAAGVTTVATAVEKADAPAATDTTPTPPAA